MLGSPHINSYRMCELCLHVCMYYGTSVTCMRRCMYCTEAACIGTGSTISNASYYREVMFALVVMLACTVALARRTNQ